VIRGRHSDTLKLIRALPSEAFAPEDVDVEKPILARIVGTLPGRPVQSLFKAAAGLRALAI
jgi:hypothetical protein